MSRRFGMRSKSAAKSSTLLRPTFFTFKTTNKMNTNKTNEIRTAIYANIFVWLFVAGEILFIYLKN